MNRHRTPAPKNAALPPVAPGHPHGEDLDRLIADYHAGRFGAGMLAVQAYLLGRRHTASDAAADERGAA